MIWRMLVMLGVVGAIIVGLVVFKTSQIAAAGRAVVQRPPEAVTSIVAAEESWSPSLHAVGTVVAVNGVTVSADLPGIVAGIAFESGKPVKRGDLLVQLDAKQEGAQFRAAEARRDLAKLNLDRTSGLLTKDVSSRSDYDAAVAEFKQAEASVAEYRAIIERKTIRAPFDGVLGIREVNLGQFLEGGARVVPLQSLDPIYVNFSLPQQDLRNLKVGGKVRVTAEGVPDGEFEGTITAVNAVVDERTRNVQAQATLANPEGRLLPGMYVTADVPLDQPERVIALPASAVSYAPYGDSVYVIEEMKGPQGKPYRGVSQKFVKLGATRGDQVAVVSGLASGEEVVTSGVFKMRPGAAVEVHNEIQPGNSPAPKPEDA
jgi:membrane fusion protein (multidrug efflux system)